MTKQTEATALAKACEEHLKSGGDAITEAAYASGWQARAGWEKGRQERQVDEETAIRAMWSMDFGHSLMQYAEDAKRGVDSSDHVRRAAYEALRPYLRTPQSAPQLSAEATEGVRFILRKEMDRNPPYRTEGVVDKCHELLSLLAAMQGDI